MIMKLWLRDFVNSLYVKIKMHNVLVFIPILLLTSALSSFYAGKYVFLKNDISLEVPVKSMLKAQKWLISFGDGEVYEANQNFLTSVTVNKGFDAVVNYKKKHIDHIFYEQNKKILDQKRGSGYWLWKPYFILKTLNKMEEGDFLFYMDSGVVFLGVSETYIKKMNLAKNDILLFDSGCTNKCYVKRDVFDIMNMNEKYRDELHIDAGLGIIIRNTKESRKFVEEWLHYCKDERLLTDLKSKNEEYSDFKDHRHDQAILSMMYHKYSTQILLISDDSDRGADFYHHRRRDMHSSLSYEVFKLKVSRFVDSFLKR